MNTAFKDYVTYNINIQRYLDRYLSSSWMVLLAPPIFDRSVNPVATAVNPISTREADYAPTSLLAPPDFHIFLRPDVPTTLIRHAVLITYYTPKYMN